jgi:hypothetical protein
MTSVVSIQRRKGSQAQPDRAKVKAKAAGRRNQSHSVGARKMMRLLISQRLIKLMRDFEGGDRVVGKSILVY